MTKAKKASKGARQSRRKTERAKFWSQQAKAFRKGQKEYPRLRGHWNSITDIYDLLGSEQARDHFLILAKIATEARGSLKDIEPWKLWLAELIYLKINCHENPHTYVYPVGYLGDPVHKLRTLGDVLPVGDGYQQTGSTNRVFEGRTVTVNRLFEASAVLCDLLESEAMEGRRVHGLRIPSMRTRVEGDPQKAKARETWLSAKLAGNLSIVDLSKTTKVAYNTIEKYRSGVTTTQTARVRRGIANAFNKLGVSCDFSEVPE
jgi:hypothetical protein